MVKSQGRFAAVYGLLLGLTVVGFFVIRYAGETWFAGASRTREAVSSATSTPRYDLLLHVLLGLVVVIVCARLLGALFRYFGQPPVIGEVLAGILLGPSFLGHVAPELAAYLMPPVVSQYFSVLAQIGVILYMFIVGLEVDTTALRAGSHATVAISHASISVPFLLGAVLALALYPQFSSGTVSFTVFALFMGVSMSVTAFPVLARILTDRRMHRTNLGMVALMCAAVDDVTAWCLLAVVVSIVHAKLAGSVLTIALTVAYIAFILFIVRPLVTRWSRRVDLRGDDDLGQPVIAAAILLLLISALTTEYIGIHAIFGAFLLGVVFPHDGRIARELTHRMQDVVVVLLLPAFFAYTGTRTEIGLVNGMGQWLWCLAIILVACLGKFGGSAIAARWTGMGWRDAAALGILMNTRGLVELIVLNIGLDLGVLSPALFTMLVLMALVTTFMTTPILTLFTRTSSAAVPAARHSPSTIV